MAKFIGNFKNGIRHEGVGIPQMEKNMMENGKMAKGMGKGHIHIQMEENILVIGKMIIQMARLNIFIRMGNGYLLNGKMENMLAIGKIINCKLL